MQFIKGHTGSYPYPFLDKLPFPVGPFLIVVLAFTAIFAFTQLGRRLRAAPLLTKVRSFIQQNL